MNKTPTPIPVNLKYRLYENSVQAPEHDIELFNEMYEDIYKESAGVFREDFSGTFQLSCEWIKFDKRNTAIAVDLSSEVLEYGIKQNAAKLTADQQARLSIVETNVLTPPARKVDVVAACNFSFYIFKTRLELIRYFKSCHRSFKKNGILILEMAGGPGFIEAPFREQRSIKFEKGPNKGEKWFTYYWQHKTYNPINCEGLYAIHFRMADGTYYRDAFEYDWRVWTIPEVRDCLKEAGFSDSIVYWDTDDDSKEISYEKTEKADNDHTWLAYVVGVK